MAKPAFIYAFDNLGPERFAELCGSLLSSRYKNFLLGGIGPDGGVDGEWHPEIESTLLDQIIEPGELVVFQLKHKVSARGGQIKARNDLLNYYKCRPNKECELHKGLILTKAPKAYVLVTNVEVNSEFRQKFLAQCRLENPSIATFLVIGLDELETWVTMEPNIRHLYFPTIFGLPTYFLQLNVKTL